MSAVDASVVERLETYSGTPPPFGHAMHKYFGFDPKYVNLNHGSYGSLPLPVAAYCEKIGRQIEASPDRFMRVELASYMRPLRARIAKLVGAERDEIVLVPNASHGVSTVLWNIEWHEQDILVGTSTTYNAVERNIRYLGDIPPHPRVREFQLNWPLTHSAIVDAFRAHIQALKATQNYDGSGPKPKIVAVIDGIVSNPGVAYPWKELTKICHEEGVWSVVDAAHCIGQEVDINLSEVKPDFWVSNCHKWLYAKRGCAVLYVPKRNQHIIKSAFPTPHAYVSPTDPQGGPEAPNFIEQFGWTGTRDYAPYLSVDEALNFREWLGGERKINEYCHSLALEGGKRLAEVMGTRVLDETGELTLNMTNVELPLSANVPNDGAVNVYFQKKLLVEWNTYAAHFFHNGKWYLRASAQIWNEISDFDYLGKAFKSVCAELEASYANGPGLKN
ncbi:hypothetical protein HETIRDRAFT_444532 [Heterobasidion irregulare TC 32-1]|uniref:Aminotransferase class V domain-containing protein n=1 Tax=Heterobasidion irregulare (strain TC 32-1) TaxID=747525 RepID=W4KB78_HETIT|nr:uncharacterized protein HETIRDRAFT_444532 [Heterobasidion irregulare TC 32-1]ETW82979.1 hypothetical protein HETIRDRAFT_444532 [Heterobasidion irregulare TC 32-1]